MRKEVDSGHREGFGFSYGFIDIKLCLLVLAGSLFLLASICYIVALIQGI